MLGNVIADTTGFYDQQRSTLSAPWKLSSDRLADLWSLAGDDDTGIAVDERSALECAGVFSAICLISETLASLPIKLFEYQNSGATRAESKHPVAKLFRFTHDGRAPSFQLIETLTADALAGGSGYARITRSHGLPTRLEVLPAPRVQTVVTNDGELGYVVTHPRGEREPLLAGEVFHLRGPSFDGLRPYSRIGLARRAVALMIAAERFSGSYFSDGASPSIGLEHPEQLSDEAIARLERRHKAHSGFKRAHRVYVAEEGAKIVTIGADPNKSQLVETRNAQLLEICRVFRVPPRLLMAELGGLTYSNVEQDNANFVQFCLRPWAVRWVSEIDLKLNPNNDVYAEFLFDALLQATTSERYAAYQTGLGGAPFLQRDEVRRRENLPPWPEEEEPLAQPPTPPPQPPAPPADDETRSLAPVFLAAEQRLNERYAKAIANQAKRKLPKNVDEFRAWGSRFVDESRSVIAETLQPLVEASEQLTGRRLPAECFEGLLAGRTGGLVESLRSINDAASAAAALKSLRNQRIAERSAETTRREILEALE